MPEILGASKNIWNFDPRAIPGCQVWLDATDSNTIVYSSGSNVRSWKDKAPYGNYAIPLQGTPTRVTSAINGLPAMYLDGPSATSAAFTGTCPPNVTNQLTVFAVFTVESGTNEAGRLFSLMYPDYQNPYSMFPLGYRTASNTMRVERNSVGYDGTSNAVPYGTPTLASCTVNGASVIVHVNGTQILNASTIDAKFGYTYYTIGCFAQSRGVNDSGVSPWNGGCWKGYLGELVLYSNTLSSDQRQQVEGYLSWKWGLQYASLPNPLLSSMLSGTYTVTGNYATFTGSGTVTVASTTTVGYFAVGGGGGGGFFEGGGGGGGGYQTGTLTLSPGTYNVVIGQGGAGGSGGVGGGNGTNTTFGSTLVVAFGGGGGATSFGTGPGSGTGIGSGGGGAYNTSAGTGTQGGNGAYVGTASLAYGGGGGGAGGNAVNNIGGPGILFNGSYYGGGGGGGGNQGNPGAGGSGGGGAGGGSGTPSAQSSLPNPTAGTNGLGGGGGGQGYQGGNVAAGGSGCFIITLNTSFSYTGSMQTYTVPSGVTQLYVYMWGGGGAAAVTGQGNGLGGAGAYVQGILTTTPGETLDILVAGGGLTDTSPAIGGYGGGGNGNNGGGTYSGGPATNGGNGSGGGGRSAIRRSGTDIVTAGGGGGAGYNQGGPAAWTGTATAGSGNGGGGGTPTTGGAYGSGGNPTAFGVGTAGSQFQGGYGNNYGGGGGGGWYGGGGGATTGGLGGDGGGGSSYTTNLASATGSNGTNGTAPGTSLSFYIGGVAAGGNAASTRSGGNGLVVVSTTPLATIPRKLPTSHPFYYTTPSLRAFRPIDIDGCALWLDAADATTLSPSGVASGANVTQWNDKSGNNWHAVGYNNTATYAPTGLNSKPALTFSSTKSMVAPVPAGTFPTAMSAFVVYQFSGSRVAGSVYTIINRTIGSTGAACRASPFSIYEVDGTDYRYTGNGTGQQVGSAAGTAFTSTTPSILYFTFASNAATTWNESVNGATSTYSISSGTSVYGDTASNVCIGGRLDTPVFMNGVISEVIMYNSTLTSAQRQQVETHLIRKWGLPMPSVGVSSTTPPLTNCKLWLDGADILGTGAPAPTTITTWADKSGTGNTVAANSLTTGQAIASSPMGVFTNQACYFSVTGGLVGSIVNTPFVIFIVETPAAYLGGTYFMFGNDSFPAVYTNNTLHIGYRNSGQFTCDFYANGIEVVQSFPNGVTRVWAFYLPSSGNRTTRLNGSIVGTGNTTRLGNFNAPVIGRIFGNYNDAYTGTISEILVYNTDIGLGAVQSIESYLIAKWQSGTLVPKFTIPADVTLPFSPLQITGCCLWLDGNDPAGTGVQPSTGALATWTDKSGSSNHMTAAGTTPTFSNFPPGAVTFGGAGYYSNASPVLSNIYTAFFVYKQTGSSGSPLYTTGATSGSNGLLPNESGTTYFTRGDSTWYTTTSPFASNVVNLAVTSFSSNVVGSNQSLYYNGSNVVTTTQANTITYTNLLIGSRQSGGTAYFTGNMYEVIGYKGTLTTRLRQCVEGYLAQKWKL